MGSGIPSKPPNPPYALKLIHGKEHRKKNQNKTYIFP